MKVTLSENNTREFVPIFIKVSDVESVPSIIVKPREISQIDAFSLTPEPEGNHYTAHFWLQQTGDYDVLVTSGLQSQTLSLSIKPQIFLSFGMEFTLFFITLTLAALGVAIWYKKTKKKKSGDGSISVSLPRSSF